MPEVRQSSPVQLERVSPESDSRDFFEVSVANRPVPVRIEYSAIRELHRQLAGEGESLGLLLGSASREALSVQRCERLALAPGAMGDPKSLPGAFRHSLKAWSQTPVEDAPQLLGCFRTQVSGWPGMKESDLEIAKRSFPGADSLFLLIRTTRHRPWLAALYSLDAKAAAAPAEPVLEFPFDEYLLRNGYLTDLVQTPEREDIQEEPKKTKTVWIVASLLIAILLAGSAAAYKFKSNRPSGQAEVAGRNAPATPALNLKVNRSGKDFEVSWDRLSTAVQQSASGMLTINDGALTRAVTLSGPQLREGRILYTPLFEELTFRLEVATPDQGTAAESVQVLAWSGKQPADLLTVAPPDPLTNSPARVIANGSASTPLPVSPIAVTTTSKFAPAPNILKQPPSAKQPQPAARPASVPETIAVIQPPPPNVIQNQDVAPAAPARVPETAPRPAVSEPVNTPPPAQPAAAPAPKPESKPEAPPIVQSTPSPAAPSLPPATVAPTITTSASPAPVAPTTIGPNTIVPAVPIRRVAPALPRGVPGGTSGAPRVISVRVMVDSAGSVQSSEVVASNPKGAFGEALLKSAALDAAKLWKFRPGQVNGKNIAAEYTIDFQFK
jgi:TonB family protein